MKLIFVVLTAIGLTACSSTAPTETQIPKIPVSTHTLANGLEILLVEDHRLPQVAVDLWYHVGPVNEDPGRTGFAHLFEHMMFQKSKHIPEDSFFRLLEGAGASDYNGTTGFDRTNYFETVPSNQLELVLWLESDRMGYLLDDLTAESFKNQQDVVRNERRQRTENVPFGMVEEAVYQNLFPKGHPYYAVVIGSHEDIQRAQLEDVKKFFKQYYTPNNASIAIVGDIDSARTIALVEKYFGTFKKGPEVPPVTVTTPPITAERRLTVKDRVELPRLYMAWITPPIFTPGEAEANLAGNLLGGDKVSRLYKNLVYEKQIAQEVYTYVDSGTLGTTFTVVATAAPGHTLEEIERQIDAELEALRTKPPESAELEGAKRSLENGILFSLERYGSSAGVADRINMYNHYLKKPDYLADDVARYRQVTPEGIRDFAAKYLANSARVVVYGVPGDRELGPPVPTPKVAAGKGGGESVNADEPWRAQQPAAGPQPVVVIPTPESFELTNGLTVILNQRKGPTVAAGLVFRSGSGANPSAQPGLAGFTLDMLDEGTATRSSMQLAEELKRAGAGLEQAPARDSSSLVLTSARGNVSEGFDLLADVVMNPAFSEKEIERLRKTRLGELTQMKEDPGQVADRVLTLALVGPANPYAYPVLGTEASVKAISAQDLRNFWSGNMTPKNAAIVVSGEFTKAELQPMIEKSFGKWNVGGALAAVNAPSGSATQASRLVLVDTPGAAQTQLRVATIGPTRSTPDYPQLEVMNMILGSMFSSRINMNLRETNGYSYGAYSWVRYLRNGGWIGIGSGVRTDVTAPAVHEVLNEVKKMGDGPVTAEEMMLAKESIIRVLPSAFETTSQTVNMLTDLYVYDLGLSYYSMLPEKIQKVTDADVQAVTKKYLVPDKLLVVTVGDQKVIAPGLSALGLGKPEVRDTEGNVKE